MFGPIITGFIARLDSSDRYGSITISKLLLFLSVLFSFSYFLYLNVFNGNTTSFRLYLVTIYLLCCSIVSIMSSIRKTNPFCILNETSKVSPAALRNVRFYWNSFLAIMSLMGAVHLIPFVLKRTFYASDFTSIGPNNNHNAFEISESNSKSLNFSFTSSVCAPAKFRRSSGSKANATNNLISTNRLSNNTSESESDDDLINEFYWLKLFVDSKILEFGDTLLLVLSGKTMTLLHVYHHSSTMLTTWLAFKAGDAESDSESDSGSESSSYSNINSAPEGMSLWIAAINYLIHVFMYTYFALQDSSLQDRGFLAKYAMRLTMFQIIQFVFYISGFLVALFMNVRKDFSSTSSSNYACQCNYTWIFLLGGQQISFLILFMRFADEKYGLRILFRIWYLRNIEQNLNLNKLKSNSTIAKITKIILKLKDLRKIPLTGMPVKSEISAKLTIPVGDSESHNHCNLSSESDDSESEFQSGRNHNGTKTTNRNQRKKVRAVSEESPSSTVSTMDSECNADSSFISDDPILNHSIHNDSLSDDSNFNQNLEDTDTTCIWNMNRNIESLEERFQCAAKMVPMYIHVASDADFQILYGAFKITKDGVMSKSERENPKDSSSDDKILMKYNSWKNMSMRLIDNNNLETDSNIVIDSSNYKDEAMKIYIRKMTELDRRLNNNDENNIDDENLQSQSRNHNAASTQSQPNNESDLNVNNVNLNHKSTALYPIKLAGMGIYLPKTIVTNDDVAKRFHIYSTKAEGEAKTNADSDANSNSKSSSNHSKKWETPSRLGVHSRRWCVDKIEEENQITNAAKAIRHACKNSNINLNDIDLIINASGIPHQVLPDDACLIQEELGLGGSGVRAFSVHSTCLSWVVGLEMAASMISNQNHNQNHKSNKKSLKNVIVVASCVSSTCLIEDDPHSLGLFGDGAAAAVVQPCSESDSNQGIHNIHFETYGSGKDCCRIQGGGTYRPLHSEKSEKHFNQFEMDGPATVRMVSQLMRGCLERMIPGLSRGLKNLNLESNNSSDSEINWVIPHQASGLALSSLECFNWPKQKIITTLSDYGNTVAASIPLTLYRGIYEEGKIKRGDKLLLVGTSAGISLGGMLLTY